MADLKSLCKESKLDIKLIFDIRYADDTTIMSTVFDKPQLSTEELQAASVGNMVQKSINKKSKVITSSEKRIVPERD